MWSPAVMWSLVIFMVTGHIGMWSPAVMWSLVIFIEVTPITYWSGLGNRVSVRVRFYGYV